MSIFIRSNQQKWMGCGVLWAVKNSRNGYAPAVDHTNGAVLGYVLAPHQDQALLKLVNLLKPFGIRRFFTDAWGASVKNRRMV